MDGGFMHALSLFLVKYLNNYAKREGNDYLRLVYCMEAFIMNVSKLFIILMIALVLGSLHYTIAVLIGFNAIRRTAFGAHASSSAMCTLSSTALFVILPYFIRNFAIGNVAVLLIFTVIMLTIILYAPADTEARPLVSHKKRMLYKKQTVLSGLIVMLIALITKDCVMKTMLTLGSIYEGVSILPITYRILSKQYNNYLKYEIEN